MCTGEKPGTCPTVSVDCVVPHNATKSHGACAIDADCVGAQVCCAYDHCDTSVCRDPLGLWECVYEGRIYRVGSSFQPDPCTQCHCMTDKTLGAQNYGGAVCIVQDCVKLGKYREVRKLGKYRGGEKAR